MKLLAGSYEKFIWGFSVDPLPTSDQPGALTLKPLFSFPSHSAPIKSVAVAGTLAASGGADDAIKVYDLSSSSEVGTLLDHSGAVTALAFYTSHLAPSLPRNLISGSNDGAVSIYDADSFVHLKIIPAHRRGVSDLAVHPSGRLALTVGRDSCLAMLNLVRGRRSFYCRLGWEASIVRYGSEGGGSFFMVNDEKVSMHDSEDARVIHEMNAQKRVLCIAPCEGGVLFTGGEDRSITGWDTTSGKVVYCIEDAHSARVKGLVAFKRSDGQSSGASNFLASASSDGLIRIWDVRMITKEKSNPLAETNTNSRLTCLAGSSIKFSSGHGLNVDLGVPMDDLNDIRFEDWAEHRPDHMDMTFPTSRSLRVGLAFEREAEVSSASRASVPKEDTTLLGAEDVSGTSRAASQFRVPPMVQVTPAFSEANRFFPRTTEEIRSSLSTLMSVVCRQFISSALEPYYQAGFSALRTRWISAGTIFCDQLQRFDVDASIFVDHIESLLADSDLYYARRASLVEMMSSVSTVQLAIIDEGLSVVTELSDANDIQLTEAEEGRARDALREAEARLVTASIMVAVKRNAANALKTCLAEKQEERIHVQRQVEIGESDIREVDATRESLVQRLRNFSSIY